MALTIATVTGKYSGRQPAMTEAIATFSALMLRRRTGSTPMMSEGARRAAARNRATASSVGGTTGRPSVQPLRWNSSFASAASSTSRTALSNPVVLLMRESRPRRSSNEFI